MPHSPQSSPTRGSIQPFYKYSFPYNFTSAYLTSPFQKPLPDFSPGSYTGCVQLYIYYLSSASGLSHRTIITLKWGPLAGPPGEFKSTAGLLRLAARGQTPAVFLSLHFRAGNAYLVQLPYFFSCFSQKSSPFLLFLNSLTTHFILLMKPNASPSPIGLTSPVINTAPQPTDFLPQSYKVGVGGKEYVSLYLYYLGGCD